MKNIQTMKKIKTSHPFTVAQLKTLNTELAKISNAQIVALRGVNIPTKDNYESVEILHSPFTLDVFLRFIDVTNPERPKGELYGISSKGILDKKVRAKMDFKNFSDRIHFFNNLIPVDFYE